MGDWKIYHNSRCSKSRDCLAMLYDNDVTATVVDYLRTPPTPDTLRVLVKKLGVRPAEIVRKKEPVFAGLHLDLNNDEAVLHALSEHPILIERPIIEYKDKAVVGRPPERLRDFLRGLGKN